jgi:PIN domain nuclease of toxin-antitoxin system
MKLLLDTHVFLWLVTANERLGPDPIAAIRRPTTEVFVSVVSIWEAVLKHAAGKLALEIPADRTLREARDEHGIASLPLTENAVRHLLTLPTIHRDPFDRMLVCQAIEHDLVLVTADRILLSYPVSTLAIP